MMICPLLMSQVPSDRYCTLQHVLVSLLLPTTGECAMFKLTVESLLRQPVLTHTDDMSDPAKLG